MYEAQVEIKVTTTYTILMRRDALTEAEAAELIRHEAMGLTEYQIKQEVERTHDESLAWCDGQEISAVSVGQVEEVEPEPDERAEASEGEAQAWGQYGASDPEGAWREATRQAEEE